MGEPKKQEGLPENFTKGLGEILKNHLEAESGTKGDDWQIDVFTNDFEDEFPFDPDAPNSPYSFYSPEANRAELNPYGEDRNNRPKIQELNQPELAKARGWRVIDLYPERNKKIEFYRIAGTPAEIRLLSQQIRHLREIIKNAVGDISFEEWFKEWEKGFPSFIDRFHAQNNQIITNYPLADYAGPGGKLIEAWRKDISSRPTYIKWKSFQTPQKKYLVIEYFPNRSEEKSILLSGTEGQIVEHIIKYHYGGGGGIDGEYDEKVPTEISTLSNRPYIKLYFSQPTEEVADGKRAARMEITINIMDKTDLTIDKSDLVAMATRITEEFTPGENPYKHKKGKNYYTYHDWANGYQIQLLANSENEARKTLVKVLAIRQHQLNEKYWKESRAVNVNLAYPNTEEEVQIMGKTYKKPLRRPSVNVSFRWARLTLPSIGKHFILASGEKRMPVSPEAKKS